MTNIKINRHKNVELFLMHAEEWLLQREAEQNLIIGLAYKLRTSKSNYEEPLYFTTIEQNHQITGCAIRTPPHKLIVTQMPLEAAERLAEDITKVYDILPAVIGPRETARAVAEAWSRLKNTSVREGMNQGIYAIERLKMPELPEGHARLAKEDDRVLTEQWMDAFSEEAIGNSPPSQNDYILKAIKERRLLLWEDGQPVSMAVEVSSTPNGARIGAVYTPPLYRNRGYASAVTAMLTSRLLNKGKQFCILFADLSNPVSNNIYKRMGYQMIDEVVDFKLQ